MIPRRCRVRCVGDVLSVFCLKLFAEGGRVGRPLGNLMCAQLCMCMCSCLNITAVVTAATSQWLPCDWRPDILPRSLPTVSPAPLALSPTSPSLHTLSMSFTFCLPLNPIFSSIHLQVHYLSLSPTSFCMFSSLAPSFAVWVFPVFRHALCAHRAACLCLYGNPEWTRVAQRSVRRWYRTY